MADVLDRDAGFCSGGDEDDMEAEDGIHSPTDASEDSVDVKVQAISLRNRNKRKCAEPRKLDTELPAKKRKIDLKGVGVETSNRSPFRPWSSSPPPPPTSGGVGVGVNRGGGATQREDPVRFASRNHFPLKLDTNSRTGETGRGVGDVHVMTVPTRLPSPQQYPPHHLTPQDFTKLIPFRVPPGSCYSSVQHQEEPLSLVSKRKDSECEDSGKAGNYQSPALRLPKGKCSDGVPDVRVPLSSPNPWPKDFGQATNNKIQTPVSRVNDRGTQDRLKLSGVTGRGNVEKKTKTEVKVTGKPEESSSHYSDNKFRIDSLLSSVKAEGSSTNGGASTSKSSQGGGGGQQRNYKNMTRERRIEANARERTRVHTISAAFDTLRHSIPAYSHNQKLSKLSVLRIACSYIMTLSRLAGYDYSKDQSEPDLSNCVDNVSKTIQTEGKIRKKKED